MNGAISQELEAHRAEAMKELRRVIDPELGRDIVSLGLIYDLVVTGSDVMVVMTLTTRGCPMQGPITDGVRRVLSDLPWVETASVQLVWEPPWTPERIRQ